MNVIDIFSSFLAIDVLELDNTELEAFCRSKITNDKTNIWHYVDQRNSSTDRISIAFDTKIKLK